MELLALRLVLVVALLGGAAWWLDNHGYQRAKDEQAVALAEAQRKADEVEDKWQANVNALIEVNQNEIRRISTQRDTAIASLRSRAAERLPEASRAACAGASPAELSRPDAEAFIQFAADAERLRASYATCKAYVDSDPRPTP